MPRPDRKGGPTLDRHHSAPLAGRAALVTGAGGGVGGNVGAGIALVLAQQGATVCVNDLTDASVEKTVADLTALGLAAIAAPGDVSRSDDVSRLVGDAERSAGPIDVLVNNAGIVGKTDLKNIGDDDWRSVMGVNLDGPFFTARAVLPGMIERGFGRIVNIASVAGIRISFLGGAAYTASKSGLIGLTRHLSLDGARHGVTVNAVLPGFTISQITRDGTSAESLSEIEASIPASRAGTPRDVANVVAFLASDASEYINGAAMTVDGGLSALPGDASRYTARDEVTA